MKRVTVNGKRISLKDCPFCGSKPFLEKDYVPSVFSHTRKSDIPVFYVGCMECGVTSCSCEKASDAVKAWNLRVK